MNTLNLEVGKIYKNYPDLCNALNESVKTNNSKKAQQKEWARFFEWERIGHGYKITKIYDRPKPKEQGRKKPSKYANAVYAILLNELLDMHLLSYWTAKKENYPKLWYKKMDMLSLLGFAREIDCYIKTENNTEKMILDEIRDNCKKVFYNEVKRIFTNLEKTKRLRIRSTYLIKHNGEDRVANRRKTRVINSIKRKLLKEFDCKNEYEIFNKQLNKEFYENLCGILWLKGISYKGAIYEVSLYLDREIKDTITDRLNDLDDDIRLSEKYLNEQRVFLHEHFYKYVETANKNNITKFLRQIDIPQCIIDEYHTEFACMFYKEYENMQRKFTEQLLTV